MAERQRIGIFSLEMSQEQLVERLQALHTGIAVQRLNTGMIEEDEWEKIFEANNVLSQTCIRVDEVSAVTLSALRSHARREARVGYSSADYRLYSAHAALRGCVIQAGESRGGH